MNIESILRKEGIIVLEELSSSKVHTIAKNVSSKLCLAFPDHNLNRSALSTSFSRLNMYIAHMPGNLGGAKYFYKNNSIYFSDSIPFEELADIALHECIHFVQEMKDLKGNLIRMGLYDMISGLGINEATVQLMAAEANMAKCSEEKYFGITLNTISPDYYPLECSLVNQIAYFTGSYPLYQSTLNSNDIFKNTFIAKTGAKTYNKILRNLDRLLKLENDLARYSSNLQEADKMREIKLLNDLIYAKKGAIISLFFATQNLIMKKFFMYEFNNIRTLADVQEVKQRLYDYKNVIGTTKGYEFYNQFYREMMEVLEERREFIAFYGEINLFEETGALVLIDEGLSIRDACTLVLRKLQILLNKRPIIHRINEVQSIQ